MDLLKQFKEYIKKENLFQPKDRLLLAVSGGVDSVVLCELCKQAGYDFVIAHCNFQLRGAESERDEQFVKKLGEKYGVEVVVKKFDTKKYIEETKKGTQEAARDLRYEWFQSLIGGQSSEVGSRFILTAHHVGDNVETLLMNFFKGTGINGLHGILSKQGKIVRPLLFAQKRELKQFAEENNLQFVEDSSNLTDKYTRNYFRNQLIPELQKVFPQVENNLTDNLQRFKEIEQLYQQSIDLHKKKLLELKGTEVHIPVLKLLKTEPLSTIVYEIIKEFGFTSSQTNDVIALLQSQTGKYIQSSSHRIIKNRKWLIISPNQSLEAENILVEETDKKIEFANGVLEFNQMLNAQYSILNSKLVAQLDADEIGFPLLLRKWKQGDYFYPLGMNKKKKLSRFFIDQKLSLTEKENVWVIEMNKKIIWVVGLRIDNRFKITDKTKNVFLITLGKAQ
jgi:tRNA(Ile)-lysidine synthase